MRVHINKKKKNSYKALLYTRIKTQKKRRKKSGACAIKKKERERKSLKKVWYDFRKVVKIEQKTSETTANHKHSTSKFYGFKVK